MCLRVTKAVRIKSSQAYYFLGETIIRMVNYQDIRSWISFLLENFRVFFLQISMNVSVFFRVFCETAVVSCVFLGNFARGICARPAGQNGSPRASPVFNRCVNNAPSLTDQDMSLICFRKKVRPSLSTTPGFGLMLYWIAWTTNTHRKPRKTFRKVLMKAEKSWSNKRVDT